MLSELPTKPHKTRRNANKTANDIFLIVYKQLRHTHGADH